MGPRTASRPVGSEADRRDFLMTDETFRRELDANGGWANQARRERLVAEDAYRTVIDDIAGREAVKSQTLRLAAALQNEAQKVGVWAKMLRNLPADAIEVLFPEKHEYERLEALEAHDEFYDPIKRRYIIGTARPLHEDYGPPAEIGLAIKAAMERVAIHEGGYRETMYKHLAASIYHADLIKKYLDIAAKEMNNWGDYLLMMKDNEYKEGALIREVYYRPPSLDTSPVSR